ncbi:hypothetical protein ACFSM5_07020 [Lacibacterium aquatile]|uniref:DUF3052 family protein n=1 Tax=Lacibacterium aquatile TaxID=1168082 RepID=A0ABW5DRX8_9PROT
MGREARCKVTVAGRSVEGLALLESDAIILRGGYAARLPRGEILSAKVQGEALILTTSKQVTSLTMGVAEAARWAATLANPRTRLEKLGIKAGTKVFLVDVEDDEIAEELARIGAPQTQAAEATVLLIGVACVDDLGRTEAYARTMPPAAHLWVLRPKGKGMRVSEAEVMAAGRTLGLSLSKTLSFSEKLTGERFTWPRVR